MLWTFGLGIAFIAGCSPSPPAPSRRTPERSEGAPPLRSGDDVSLRERGRACPTSGRPSPPRRLAGLRRARD